MADSIRDALVEAVAKHETDTPDVAETPVVETAAPETPVEETAPKIESAATEVPTPPVKDGGEKSPLAASAPPVSTPPATGLGVAPAKAPRSWSADAKAAFATLPEAVKQDVLRREKEISTGLEHAAPARKHYEAFNEVVKPFQPLFDAYGVSDPLPVMRELLTARATLEIGTPEQKAQFITNLIYEFGGPEVVGLIDNMLVQRGQPQPFTPARPVRRPDYSQDPALAPLFALAEQAKQAQYARAEQAVDEIKNLPHYEELRDDIADVIESYHAAGKSISVPDAYRRALAMNPAYEQPSSVPNISKSQAAAILASRNAASSVSGAPRVGAKAAPTDRRSQIVAAMEAAR